ncbi:hypothetical protein [Acrocarpospora pleiomorpha]|uniref:hypothetical protein n=1 Tax=Acrocarpospora pleiomorpha TaxID=90975 RepID=UPI0012D342B1|nr:hypothetical protein [Acrocarpospora pleiomorpha]
MAANQIAVIVAPPALGLLTDLTGSIASAWFLLAAMTTFALPLTAGQRGPDHENPKRPNGDNRPFDLPIATSATSITNCFDLAPCAKNRAD